jgi:hypothetical protein
MFNSNIKTSFAAEIMHCINRSLRFHNKIKKRIQHRVLMACFTLKYREIWKVFLLGVPILLIGLD